MPTPYAPQQVRKVLAARRHDDKNGQVSGRAASLPPADETTKAAATATEKEEAAEVVAPAPVGYFSAVAPMALWTRVTTGRR
ncbi:hypothetical protein OsI_29498 [Oryza sativa Indica Group]|uniref:Uncharacterized protein n=1 Tax=Oryza sativa subsp. indica TaxID=39946 RepID=B8BBL5_ORYSI|nr:hypothetical protein OsI_29498 [Oryza sativa Indica Group]